MAKRKNKANNKIEELTDLLKGMSPTQLATLEGFIAGERQGENVRGLQDYENMAAAAPGLGVATAAPATAFGNLPTLSDTSARAGAGREAVAASERAATQRNLATQASANTGIQPEKGRSRLSKLWGGIKGGVKSAADWANQGDFKDPRRGIRPRNVSPQEWEARQGRVQQQEDIAANKHGLMGPSYSGFAPAAQAAQAAQTAATTPAQTGGPPALTEASRRGMERARRRFGGRGFGGQGVGTTPPVAAPAPDAPVNTQETAIPMPNTDVTARRSPMGVRGPQDQMTQGTGQVSSRRNVPGPRAKTPQERQMEVMGTATDMPVGSTGALRAAGEKINTGGAQMRPAPNTVQQTYGKALYGGATSPDPKAGAGMREDVGRLRPEAQAAQLEKEIQTLMKMGGGKANERLQQIFGDLERAAAQQGPAGTTDGRPNRRNLERHVAAGVDLRGIPQKMINQILQQYGQQWKAVQQQQVVRGKHGGRRTAGVVR